MEWPYNRKPGALCSKQYNSWKPALLLPVLSGNATHALLTHITSDEKKTNQKPNQKTAGSLAFPFRAEVFLCSMLS